MVKAFHKAGIAVVLDVVYNHTCEGDHRGPIYSFKGFDTAGYYMLSSDPANPYANYSGTGNTLNFGQAHVRKMVMDSLRYWTREMHIDGFRFDLASVFSRNADGSLNRGDAPIFSEIAADPELGQLKLIAEPWDTNAYQLGRGFPGLTWLQWNGRFRDDIRRFIKGDPGMVPDVMRRIYGSGDLFPDSRGDAYHAYQSINFITCHDGFTLYDLVSYDRKRNWKNGNNNQDGMDDNYSWNCGHEGEEGVPSAVLALRRKQVKNFCCLLLLSNGIPMLRAGDEFLNTQFGNNNPYNQDNEIGWLASRMKLTGLNQLWVADITYIRLQSEFVYLAVILDSFSRKVVGWSLDRTLASWLPITALEQAIAERQPPPGLVHHSDRGVQYASAEYVGILQQHQMILSMSRPANPYDNASCESFMKTPKREEIHANDYRDLTHLRANIEAFIERYYNRCRLHSALGYRPPEEFETEIQSGKSEANSAEAKMSFFRHGEIY
jgi:transposase InsO family protein